MVKRSLNYVLKKAEKADEVIIVGAGNRGKELYEQFRKNSAIIVKSFFDNDDMLIGNRIDNVEIMKPFKDANEKVLYVIAVDSSIIRKELHSQLMDLKISADNIITYYFFRDYDYLSNLDEKDYKEELQDMYFEFMGREMNWQTPRTYTEKINWEKLYARDARKTKLVDKYLVREWVRERIGEEHLTRLYGVWDDADDINFDILPDAFVLKANNGSGRNIVVKDKAQIDRQQVCRQLHEWKNNNIAYKLLEYQYKDVIPKVICEEYLEGVAESVYDYNIFCFHGEPVYIWCIKGSHKPDCKASFYTKEWEMMPFSFGYPKDNVVAPKPDKLEEMLALSRVLSRDFQHVRVDWYNLPDGRVLFGEMTFSTWGGLQRIEPYEYDIKLGELI